MAVDVETQIEIDRQRRKVAT